MGGVAPIPLRFVLARLLWVRSVRRPGALVWACLFPAVPVGASGWGGGAGCAPAPLSGGGRGDHPPCLRGVGAGAPAACGPVGGVGGVCRYGSSAVPVAGIPLCSSGAGSWGFAARVSVVRGVCGQALPLPQLSALWAGCRGPSSTLAVGAGVQVSGPGAVPSACMICGGRAPRGWWGPSRVGRPATGARGVWCQALSLPLSPALWAAVRVSHPDAVGAGVRVLGPGTVPSARMPCGSCVPRGWVGLGWVKASPGRLPTVRAAFPAGPDRAAVPGCPVTRPTGLLTAPRPRGGARGQEMPPCLCVCALVCLWRGGGGGAVAHLLASLLFGVGAHGAGKCVPGAPGPGREAGEPDSEPARGDVGLGSQPPRH